MPHQPLPHRDRHAQHAWLSRGLDPELTSVRLANYVVSLRKELLALSHTCDVHHPAQVTGRQIEILDDCFGARTIAELFGGRGRGIPSTPERYVALASRAVS